jgi:hypothetical protein
MVIFNPFQKYRGPGSAIPGTPREHREQELFAMIANQDGSEIIKFLYEEATGIPHGTSHRGELIAGMIPAILAHEYPQ